MPVPAQADFTQEPFVLAWELTRACNLACVHCRAVAQRRRHPDELTTDECLRLIDEIARFEVPPSVILTGGDPLRRPDLIQLIRHATSRGLRTALTPAGTPLASRKRLAAARDAGLARVAISLDGPNPAKHDSFRRVPGSFAWTLEIANIVRELGLPLQIHTTLSRRTVEDLPEMADLAEKLGALLWAVFCLVPVGRAQFDDELTAEEYEEQLNWLVARSKTASWQLKLTEGYHVRRIMSQRMERFSRSPDLPGDGLGRAPQPVNAGNGFCFVSHTGDVCPSGFLPVVVGNIRTDSLIDLYRNHPVFRALRDPSLLTGKCGKCRFKRICGGSRSRAYAHSGDYLGSDPACAYYPELGEAAD